MSKVIKGGLITIAICAIFFMGWYIGRSLIDDDEFAQQQINLTEDVKTGADVLIEDKGEDTLPSVNYSIISAEDSIYLYEVSHDGKKTELASGTINLELLPGDDQEVLKYGITTEDLGEALKLWEGYVS